MSTFGVEFEQMWPKAESALKLTEFGRKLIQNCVTLEKPQQANKFTDIQEFIQKSVNFPLEFGTNTCRVINRPKDRHSIIQKQIASAYPIIHERVLALYLTFIEHKCQYGNQKEKAIYPQLGLSDFIQRLLTKRCASFVGAEDHYLLLTGEQGEGGFTKVGTIDEVAPLILANVLSYDEIKLSAFLSVSSHTEFLNDGNRFNAGIIEMDKTKIETSGVVIGLIGGRFERHNVMESQDILITPEQNTIENGYGEAAGGNGDGTSEQLTCTSAQALRRVWTEFYDDPDLLYGDALKIKSPRFYKCPNNKTIFDNVRMSKRYAISFDTLLLEADARAAATDGRQAYVHVVGIGLGVWREVDHQTQIFLETFTQRIKALLPQQLKHIGVIHFSWFHMNEWLDLKDGGIFASATHPNGGIRTFLSNRNPNDKLPIEYENMLPIVSFAWDGNALPGNEFWLKNLTATGDTSTACSTLIAELQNPHINTHMVNGDNLHIATLNDGIMHISDYSKKILQ